MYLLPDSVFRRTSISILIALASLFFVREVYRELNPLAGKWVPVRIVVNGKSIPPNEGRIFLNIADGQADMSSYWTSRAVCDTFAKGDMVVKGSDIELFGVNKEDRKTYPTPSYRLKRLENGHIGFNTTFGDGEPAWIEFKRTENMTTALDGLGWR
jgi:hypothetical protein